MGPKFDSHRIPFRHSLDPRLLPGFPKLVVISRYDAGFLRTLIETTTDSAKWIDR